MVADKEILRQTRAIEALTREMKSLNKILEAVNINLVALATIQIERGNTNE